MKQLYIDLTALKPDYPGGVTRFSLGLTGALTEGKILASARNVEFLSEQFPGRVTRDTSGITDENAVLLCPTATLNFFDKRITSILCIHDVQHVIYPENFNWLVQKYRQWNYKRSAEAATYIQVSSRAMWDDLAVAYGGRISSKVFVAPEGYDEKLWSPLLPDREPITDLIDMTFPRKFVYYPAQLWKHKNHQTVIKGLKGKNIALVLTGKDYGQLKYIQTWAYLAGVPLIYLGVIPEIEMRWLYKNAIATIAAGYYESSCLPIKEALACGGKVLAADIPCNKEIAGLKDMWLFETMSPEGFAKGLDYIMTNNICGRSVVEFQWSKIAPIYRRFL